MHFNFEMCRSLFFAKKKRSGRPHNGPIHFFSLLPREKNRPTNPLLPSKKMLRKYTKKLQVEYNISTTILKLVLFYYFMTITYGTLSVDIQGKSR